MTSKYNAAVFIGRFQPAHNAHILIIQQALDVADKLIIIIGSAHKPRTFENPFLAIEREEMLRNSLIESGVDIDRVTFEHNIDTLYSNDAWLIRVQGIVARNTEDGDRIALIGHKKEGDESTFYLDMFPQWDNIDVAPIEELNSTDIRKLYFQERPNLNYLINVLPPYITEYLEDFQVTEEFAQVVRERRYIEHYKLPYAGLPYEITFNTGDAVVTGAGHILLIKRKSEPGKGLWAIPGGFLNAATDVSVEASALRELTEETCIKLQNDTLKRNIVEEKRFDTIGRSPRGRVITTAFHIVLDDTRPLPKVRPRDDALEAKWWQIAEVKSDFMFEDHFEIINYFVR